MNNALGEEEVDCFVAFFEVRLVLEVLEILVASSRG